MKPTTEKSGDGFDRRRFLAATSAVGVASLLALPHTALAEPPPETTKLRLMACPGICAAPQYVAAPLLTAEGFTDIEYVKTEGTDRGPYVGPSRADFDVDAGAPIITYIDAGAPVVTLSGVHLGCYELFGTQRVRTIRDLKGKTVPVDGLGGTQHVLLSSMVAYVGLDPRKDINWVIRPPVEGMQLFAEGKADAYLAYPPEPQELRTRKVGHVIVNTATDKPWSEYLCCMLISYREFVQKHPVATKRAVRAILKAADLFAQQRSGRSRAPREARASEGSDSSGAAGIWL